MKRRMPPPGGARRGRERRLPVAQPRRGRKRLLGLLGLAAVGVGVAWMARRSRDERELGGGAAPGDEPAAAPPAEPDEPGRWVAGRAGRLWVRTAGDAGPAILLLHALGGSGAQWGPQLASLGDRFRVAAPDLRGHGRSASASDDGARSDEATAGGNGSEMAATSAASLDYSLESHAADALAVADALGFDRFVVVGHSLGAAIAAEVAASAPSRVFALVLVDPSADASGEPAEAIEEGIASVAADTRAEFGYHYREFLHGARRDTQKRVLADLAATPEAVLLGSYAAMMRYPFRQRLAAWRGPRLCLAGSLNDTPGSLPRLVPDLPTEWLAPASHWLQLDRPEETSHLIAELAAQAAGGGKAR
jgi:pimeloyl-ACP methyl ester carboxylesterase